MSSRHHDAALVVEGGGMRGIFSTGLFDGFLEQQFNPFRLFVGVSAGATSLAAYLAEMPGRNRKIYTELSTGPEFISMARFLRGGHLMDLDWLWNITISRMRLDLARIYAGDRLFLVGMTDVNTGKSFFKQTSAGDLEHVLKASSALPLVYRGFPEVDGLAIRSRPSDHQSSPDLAVLLMRRFLRRYPALQATVRSHDSIYRDALALIRRPPAGVSVIEICPPADFKVSRFCRDLKLLQEAYEQGRAQACSAIEQWNSMMIE